ncbi:hypothetical protein JDV02_009265 [Purpureocillium takamizusanense]|uniref:Autophagy-related protein 6 n=1 Tax=Purpureocillium takamizusanense TaxID=2060973 RepID=A0A9Q8VG40_9HYPO|nr:uncharacterized protein JDV02_009265 [Purpureocillium takamizusanense]UNI23447.1 hypothetical protein JDV02_009265 [Purpureocillium takamizusanense]
MGWLPSIFGGEKPADPLGKLDPKLREFLERESPVKYTPNEPTATTPPSTSPPQTQQHDKKPIATPEVKKPAVPSASLYQDGRYAHLWKNYRPLAQVESDSATDHDKLMGVLEDFKERKAAIGRAALENCAMQQEEWVNCMRSGSWEDQLQMCRHQVRRFERCYTMQSKFLRALGYGSVLGRPAQVDEDIQMHADTLFQRMLEHWAAFQQAQEDGRTIPVFDPKLPSSASPAPTATPTPEMEKQWREKLDKLLEDERAVEEAALRADLQARADVAQSVKKIWDTQKEERESRKAEGQATFMDTVASLFGRGGK